MGVTACKGVVGRDSAADTLHSHLNVLVRGCPLEGICGESPVGPALSALTVSQFRCGITDLLGHSPGAILQIFCSVHGRGLNLFGLALDLVASVTSQFTQGRFKFAFRVFGEGVSFV